MPRRPKYESIEEARVAHRISARKSYYKRKGEKIMDKEFDRLQLIDPNLFPTKLKLTDEQKQFVHSLINKPIDTQSMNQKQTRHNDSEAKRQIGLAMTKIRNKKKKPFESIDFDITLLRTEHEKQYLFEQLPDVIYKLLDSISFNTEHWLVSYNYKDHYKTKPLDEITEQYLRKQVEHDLKEHLHDFFEYNLEYDFFPVAIQSLTKLHFINLNQLPKRKKREGRFWRWLLKGYPEIDLSRFMIFNQLNSDTVELINKENCFVYACRMAGLSNDLIDDMCYSIHKRSISGADVSNVAEQLDLKIHIKEPGRSYTINPNGTHEIRLVLLYNHYMIDERVNVSPYYIKHRSEIMSHPKARYWKREDKMRIINKEGNQYIKSSSNTFSLRKVIQALFEVNAFEPITMNDYRAFTSLICFENIDSIKSLEYNPNLCCRLKQPKPNS